MNARGRTAAVLEVLGVYLAGQLVVNQLVGALGLQPVNPLTTFTADVTDAELIGATRQLFELLTLQYAGWFLLIIPINWWHRRRGLAAYGLTRSGRSVFTLVLIGIGTVAAAALLAWPASTLILVDAVYHLELGETVPWRQALFDTSWRRWEFWVFTGVLSWGFVAFIEELFFRGYCQRRLAEDWGHGPAIVGSALLFVFVHSQYLTLNIYNVATIVSLLILAFAFGVVFAWTGSLIPSIVAHGLINLTMTPVWAALFLMAYVTAGLMLRRPAVAAVKYVFSGATATRCAALGLIGAGYAIASQRFEGLVHVAAAMVLVAIGLEAADRKEPAMTPPVDTSS
jgi:membrane protease YdiL (CAAX protease family)